jgi:hypothetical protein
LIAASTALQAAVDIMNGGMSLASIAPSGHNIDHPPDRFGVQVQCLRDAFIDDAILLGEDTARRVTFDELVQQVGSISRIMLKTATNHFQALGSSRRDPPAPLPSGFICGW